MSIFNKHLVLTIIAFLLLQGCASKNIFSSTSADGDPIVNAHGNERNLRLEDAKYNLCKFHKRNDYRAGYRSNFHFSDINLWEKDLANYVKARADNFDPEVFYSYQFEYSLGAYDGSSFKVDWIHSYLNPRGFKRILKRIIVDRGEYDTSWEDQYLRDPVTGGGYPVLGHLSVKIATQDIFEHPNSPISEKNKYRLKIPKSKATELFTIPVSSSTQNSLVLEVIFKIDECLTGHGFKEIGDFGVIRDQLFASIKEVKFRNADGIEFEHLIFD